MEKARAVASTTAADDGAPAHHAYAHDGCRRRRRGIEGASVVVSVWTRPLARAYLTTRRAARSPFSRGASRGRT